MQRLITPSLVALFTVLSISLVVYLSSLFRGQITAIDRTQASRSRIQAQIHDSLHRRYAGQIRETRLLGRCGFTAYIATLRDATGRDSTLFFDIDTGAPIQHNLLNGCPYRVSGSDAARGAGTNIGIGGLRLTSPDWPFLHRRFKPSCKWPKA
jgi:hypothetical protein